MLKQYVKINETGLHKKSRFCYNVFIYKKCKGYICWEVITVFENIKRISIPTPDKINLNPLSINFVGETLCDEKFDISRDCSDLTSFEYIVDGYGTLEINGKVFHPKKGDIFFLPMGSKHHYYSQKENGWHKYFISFYGKLADALIENYLPADTYIFEGCFLEKNFRHIFDIAFNTEDLAEAEQLLRVELFKIFSAIYEKKAVGQLDFAERIKRNIDNHLDDEFNLDALCSYMNYSKNHIINVFSEKFGKTPYQYYLECKINLAKYYLLNTNMRVTEIAYALSYSNPQYFSICFKKFTGYSPRDFRLNAKM